MGLIGPDLGNLAAMIGKVIDPADTRLVLVVGSPRSGTTMIGTFLGSALGVLDLGEYVGYDFCFRLARNEMANMPALAVSRYLIELQTHALGFPRKLAAEAGAAWFVASAPWNLLVVSELAQAEPEAVIVLCVRQVRGVCQSLARSYSEGRAWAGASLVERAALWCDFYEKAPSLPPERTLVFDYDAMCRTPEREIAALQDGLKTHGFPAQTAQLETLTTSHATTGMARAPIAESDACCGVRWRPGASWDPSQWSEHAERDLQACDRYRTTARDLAAWRGQLARSHHR
jgi:hypothetical protein